MNTSPPDVGPDTGPAARPGHRYLSTACLHGLHARCGVQQLGRGDLGAPHCKYCPAICECLVCDHAGQAAREARISGPQATVANPARRRVS